MTTLDYITFQTATALLVLPVPEFGNTYEAERRQKLGRSDGGTLYVYDKGAGGLYRQSLAFRDLTRFEAAELRLFYDTVSVGAQTTFTFTDHRGRTATARFLNTTLQFENSGADDRYHTNIQLEVTALSDLSLQLPLLICNMEADVDDVGRHGIVRGSKLSYVSDYVVWGATSLRCTTGPTGSDIYNFNYFPDDMDLTRYKRTIAFWLIWRTGIAINEPFYPIRHYIDANNYWELKISWSGTASDFDIVLTTKIAGVTVTEACVATMAMGFSKHLQFEFDPLAPRVKFFLQGALHHTFTTITAWPFSSAGINYMKVEGDYWRIDSYAWFQGLKNDANFIAPTGPYTP